MWAIGGFRAEVWRNFDEMQITRFPGVSVTTLGGNECIYLASMEIVCIYRTSQADGHSFRPLLQKQLAFNTVGAKYASTIKLIRPAQCIFQVFYRC